MTLLNPRIQRILAAIELFALVLWIGGLFFITAFLPALTIHIAASKDEAAWQTLITQLAQFNSVEMIFALVILASNFVKAALFRKIYPMQQLALMVSALMLVFTLTSSLVLRPRMEAKMAEILLSKETPEKRAMQQFNELHREYRTLTSVNFLLGLFLVYSYRSFEERKYHAIAKLINLP